MSRDRLPRARRHSPGHASLRRDARVDRRERRHPRARAPGASGAREHAARSRAGSRARRHDQSRRGASSHRGGLIMTAHAPGSATLDKRFAWRGVDATGTQHSGTLIAPDAEAVRTVLKRDKLFIIELSVRGPAPRPQARAAEVTRFTRQLASLLRAGLPLAPSLDLFAQAPAPRQHGMS